MAIIPGSTCVIKTSVKDMDITLIDNAIFSFSVGIDETPLIQKKYQADNSGAVKYLDGAFIVPCTQQDTLSFDGNKNILYEAQLNFKDKSVSKTIYTKIPIRKTVATEIITGNAPNINQDDNYYVMQTDTAQYLNVSTEQIKGYVDLAQTYSLNAEKSEQEALEHAKYAENNKQQTYEFLSQTKALAAETSKAKDSVEGQIATATSLSNKAIEAATTAENAKNTVGDTANQVSADKEVVLNAKSDILIAKQDTITAKNEAVTAKNDAITAKDTAVEQANSASLNKDKTDTNVTTTKQLAEQVGTDKTEVSEMVTESRAILEEQRKLIGLMPTIYITQTIEEMRAIANPKEKDICFVLGNVQSAYMYYTTAIDGTALSNPTWVWLTDIQLVAPSKDYLLNILQLATVATTGSYNDLINKPKRYESFVIVDDGVWDYSSADKIKLTADLVSISNVYNGAVGLILTDLDITLPENSKKAYDYDYMDLPTGGMYQYTFLYDGSYYNWSRVVIA